MIRLEYFVRKARKELKKLLLLGTICSDEKNFESINGNYKIGCYVCKLINMMIIFSFNKLDSACRRFGEEKSTGKMSKDYIFGGKTAQELPYLTILYTVSYDVFNFPSDGLVQFVIDSTLF